MFLMRHTVVDIVTCVLRPVSTATVPEQINMLHVALIPRPLQAHHTDLHVHIVSTSLPIALLVSCTIRGSGMRL